MMMMMMMILVSNNGDDDGLYSAAIALNHFSPLGVGSLWWGRVSGVRLSMLGHLRYT